MAKKPERAQMPDGSYADGEWIETSVPFRFDVIEVKMRGMKHVFGEWRARTIESLILDAGGVDMMPERYQARMERDDYVGRDDKVRGALRLRFFVPADHRPIPQWAPSALERMREMQR